MAQVALNNELASRYGLPCVCPCCGNDNGPQLSSVSLHKIHKGTGYGCILLVLGPIGLLCYLVYILIQSRIKSLALPLCALCQHAKKNLEKRLYYLGIPLLALSIIGFSYAGPSLWVNSSLTIALLISFVLIGEFAWLQSQFSMKILKKSPTITLLRVPYSEYPAIYQRHIDNAILYEQSQQLAMETEAHQ